jgi:hypothetical protein
MMQCQTTIIRGCTVDIIQLRYNVNAEQWPVQLQKLILEQYRYLFALLVTNLRPIFIPRDLMQRIEIFLLL